MSDLDPFSGALDHAVPGDVFILDAPVDVPAVWGVSGDGRVLWPEGEPLMIVGPDGAGKTTLMEQLVLARLGLRRELLGFPVQPAAGKVLYLAADRPRQAQRSFRRMVSERDRKVLHERLVFWPGPLPFRITDDPRLLAGFAKAQGAGTVFVDSLKDVALGLTTDEVGAAVNMAHQEAIAAGVELCVAHHQRKEQNGAGKPKHLADVYGSRWLTAGCGSVLLVWADEPGDPIVELSHLKPAADVVGPLTLRHDHAHGQTTVYGSTDLETIVATPKTAKEAAAELYGTAAPSRNEVEKTRQRLNKLIAVRVVEQVKDERGIARYVVRDRPGQTSLVDGPQTCSEPTPPSSDDRERWIADMAAKGCAWDEIEAQLGELTDDEHDRLFGAFLAAQPVAG